MTFTNQTTNELFKMFKASESKDTGFAFMAKYLAQTAALPAKAFYNYLSSEGIYEAGGNKIFYEHVSAFIYHIKDVLDAQSIEGN